MPDKNVDLNLIISWNPEMLFTQLNFRELSSYGHSEHLCAFLICLKRSSENVLSPDDATKHAVKRYQDQEDSTSQTYFSKHLRNG